MIYFLVNCVIDRLLGFPISLDAIGCIPFMMFLCLINSKQTIIKIISKDFLAYDFFQSDDFDM